MNIIRKRLVFSYLPVQIFPNLMEYSNMNKFCYANTIAGSTGYSDRVGYGRSGRSITQLCRQDEEYGERIKFHLSLSCGSMILSLNQVYCRM